MATQTATPQRSTGPRQTPRQTPARATATRTRVKSTDNRPVRPFQIPFDAKNIRIIALGIAVIILGYCVMYFSPTMSDMALTVSPILLLLGYCVIVPIGIMAGVRKKTSHSSISETPSNGTINGSAA